MSMDRYKLINAAHKVEGYYLGIPRLDKEYEFKRAKSEAIKHLTAALKDVTELTFEQFQSVYNKR